MVLALHAELVHRPKLVISHLAPVHQLGQIATRFAIHLVAHRHAIDQQFVKSTVRWQQRRHTQIQHLGQRLIARRLGHMGVQPLQGFAQLVLQQHLLVVAAQRGAAIGGNVQTMFNGVAHLGQPLQCLLF